MDEHRIVKYIVQYTLDRVNWSYRYYSYDTYSDAFHQLESLRNDKLYSSHIKAVRIIEQITTQHVCETFYIKE